MKKILTLLSLTLMGVAQADVFQDDTVILPIEEIIDVNPDNFDGLIHSDKPVVLDVYATWCRPCRLLAPILEQLNDEYGASYRFAKLNVEEQTALDKDLNVRLLPTLIFFKEGKEVGRHVGSITKDALADKIIDAFEKE